MNDLLEKHMDYLAGLESKKAFSEAYYLPAPCEVEESRDYTLASAALHKLMPQFSFKDQLNILDRLAYYLRLQFKEEALDLRSITNFVGPWRDIVCGEAKILCTYHFGSYRQILRILCLEGVKIKVLMTSNAIKTQSERILSMPGAEHMEVLDAESPYSLRRCLRALESGTNILSYVDGNAGVGGETLRADGSMVNIPFLAGEISVRQGIFKMSKISGCSIVPILYKINGISKRSVCVYGNVGGASETAEYVMSKLFGILAENIKWNPSQWEGWLYFSNYIKATRRWTHLKKTRRDQCPMGDIVFNHDKYGVLHWKDKTALLDKDTLAVVNIRELSARVIDTVVRKGVLTPEDLTSIGVEVLPIVDALLEFGVLE